MDLGMDLSFTLNEEDDILNTTIRDSDSGSTVYTVKTPKYAEGVISTTVTRRSQIDGSTKFAFKLLWRGEKTLLKDVWVVLDQKTLEEIPVRDVLERASGSTTYGSVRIDDVEHKWKSKGTGSKIVLVNKDTNEIVARSHARVRNSFFRKPRNMSLEISSKILPAMDIVLLTFILVWWERQTERLKEPLSELCPNVIPLLPLPVDG